MPARKPRSVSSIDRLAAELAKLRAEMITKSEILALGRKLDRLSAIIDRLIAQAASKDDCAAIIARLDTFHNKLEPRRLIAFKSKSRTITLS
ncbi:MAG: hypothetical protein HYZ75_08140 [Elusimicrobia bacterium]|nr:hypothetical protein [Elusimicrobiota bacterium]